MNARPYIFGCLCLVGANGTAAASDIDFTRLLIVGGGATTSSSFEGGGSARDASSGGRDPSGGDGMPSTSSRRATAPSHGGGSSSPSSPAGIGDGPRDDAAPSRTASPSWQSLLPGSML
ncbi:hypothetical protein P3W24_07545 [Luteibacter sp. PPL201]|jgi:hypothetical protein|uniref:ESPR domain-containing protein n=1 Tax=Luteibacter sahnii TaxID=3021977 RepID=A0ABT6B9R0_9GAMM|nr:hypothetical protein [Luteibacter sp. PPL193]MDY1546767.1 hypothetical protein [Luteibacter sp. PPL193]